MKYLGLCVLLACNAQVAAVEDSFTTLEDTPLNIAATSLLSNDKGAALKLELPQVTSTRGGAIERTADGVRYTPKANDSGIDTFVYTVSNGGAPVPGTVTITITPVNDGPVAATDALELVREDLASAGTLVVPVLTNDSDAEGPTGLKVTQLDTTGLHGTAQINSDGTIAYNVTDCFTGVDTFKYTLSDDAGATAVGTARINVRIPGSDTDQDSFIDTEEATAGTDSTKADSVPKVLCGKLTYDRIAGDPASGALDNSAITEKPIRNAQVQLVSGTQILATTKTSQSGAYRAVWVGANAVTVRTRAEMVSPPMKVVNNVDGDSDPTNDPVYVMDSAPVDSTTTRVASFHAQSGISNPACASGCYTGPRVAAPFAILDTLYTAAQAFAALSNPPNFPVLRVNWSPANEPASGNTYDGSIGTSHYSGGELFILGLEDTDTDEFDTHVMVHEWGHYFEDKIGRSDSIGGAHSAGNVLDPRVAFGEGWGNALSAMIMYPDSVYKDSSGAAGGLGFTMNQETSEVGPGTRDPSPGWFSESSVQSILYDLFDPANETHDTLALGLQPIYDVMVGAQKTTKAFTSIFSFIHGLKVANPGKSAAIDTLVTHHTLPADTSSYGIDPIADEWGTGEAHTEEMPAFDIYTQAVVGTPVQAPLFGPPANSGPTTNTLRANRWFRVTGTPGAATVTASPVTVGQDIALLIFDGDRNNPRIVDNVYAGSEGPTGIVVTADNDILLVCHSFSDVQDDPVGCQIDVQ